MAGKFYSIFSDEEIKDLVQDTYIKVYEKKSQFKEKFWRAINKLTPEIRDVVELLMKKTPYNEMASVLGCSENAVRVKIFLARKGLKWVI